MPTTQIEDASPQVAVPPTKEQNIGNCVIIDLKDTSKLTESEKALGDAIWDSGETIDIDHYFSMTCKSTYTGQDSKFPSDWSGAAFPNNLFINRATLTTGNKLEITMQITTPQENSKNYREITFSGNRFENPITATWNGRVQAGVTSFDKSVNILEITKPTISPNLIFISIN
ncbi:hypothetical protein OVS_03240 [Mycoplasma ovis str. Michigan]|uniref:Uncharacterized protein n=1 Tax=Mycoplasma ovis str. Michigan TaxID=1415773 RepID=A0ABN4BM89_9MOLU|nr:hypothetical protein [Mycoplasma ovis]AHC40401.1 hypothetical protein OVS_03240 [Mycoplasma ovis str. Michigan]